MLAAGDGIGGVDGEAGSGWAGSPGLGAIGVSVVTICSAAAGAGPATRWASSQSHFPISATARRSGSDLSMCGRSTCDAASASWRISDSVIGVTSVHGARDEGQPHGCAVPPEPLNARGQHIDRPRAGSRGFRCLAREPRRWIASWLQHAVAVAAAGNPLPAMVTKGPETPRALRLTSDATCITMLQPASRGCHAKETTNSRI